MAREIDINELRELLKKLNIEALEDVEIEGDVELEFEIPSGGGIGGPLAYALGQEIAQIAVHLMNISQLLGYPAWGIVQPPQAPQAEMPTTLKEEKFSVGNIAEWKNKIEEVTLGATASDGGTRGHTITIGGERALPYYFDAPMPNPNRITLDVFDMPIPLAKAVRVNYEDVMHDPGEWAKKAVKEFGADMVTVHLISTDPSIKDTSPVEAAKTVEEVLQAVDVPIVIGGSGNPQKDPEVLVKAAEVAEGERCLLASASFNLDYVKIGEAAKKYNHVVLAWT